MLKNLFRSIMLIPVLASSAIAGPFTTGDSFGPREPNGETEYSTGAHFLAVKTVTPGWSSLPWVPGSGYVASYIDPMPNDVKQLLAEIEAHDRITYDTVVQGGGCNADFIPFWIAAYCGSQAFGGGQSGQLGSRGGD